MSIITDETYDNLKWSEPTWEEAMELLTGATIIEAAPVDVPIVDGTHFIVKTKAGELKAVNLLCDVFGEAETPLYCVTADIPEQGRG